MVPGPRLLPGRDDSESGGQAAAGLCHWECIHGLVRCDANTTVRGAVVHTLTR